jgi:hypothetical protein
LELLDPDDARRWGQRVADLERTSGRDALVVSDRVALGPPAIVDRRRVPSELERAHEPGGNQQPDQRDVSAA